MADKRGRTMDLGKNESPEQYTKEKYVENHRDMCQMASQPGWLQQYGHFLRESRYRLEYEYGLTREEIEQIERES